MPRIGRKYLDTSFFHIIVQGINKEYIFNKKEYMEKYKMLLESNLKKYQLKIVAYCIMNNHAHLLLYSEKIEEMSKYMKSVNTSYAKYYNNNENRVGFVFRNRYQSEPIYSEKYLLNCIGYIHNNPVKAEIVNSPEKYRYSSYNDYINKNGIVNEEILRLVFGESKNYIENYKLIHRTNIKFKDYEKNTDYKKIYFEMQKQDLDKIKEEKKLLKETVYKLVVDYRMPINKVSELFNISRFKVSRMIK